MFCLESCPVPKSSRIFPKFSSIRFSVSCCMLRALIHLKLNFVEGDTYGSICIFIHSDIQLNQHHLLKMCFIFPLCNMLPLELSYPSIVSSGCTNIRE